MAGGPDIEGESQLLHLGTDVVCFSDSRDGNVRLGIMGAWGGSSSTSDNGYNKPIAA